ncbi:unnamed protein product [Didymodactylos carnosus]|uniref:Peptidase S9 prolyl oligopeptidase catalytic domain-containing protein n=1 Tax=Didymodactylos carnosus TaxID=1234261 RepID=A0A8S2QIC0_9BILA|nr:unnamed protein product [Didymodactylos carnosus]CAF4113978.1 unnamed protein product [Didymodactylos carnosus]
MKKNHKTRENGSWTHTKNEAIETNLKLSHDNKHVFFIVYGEGSVDGKYQEYQARLYSIDIQMSSIERMASDFTGHIMDYAVSNDSIGLVILGQLGTEVHIYSQRSSTQPMVEHLSWNGTYENIATSPNLISSSIAFVYSALDKPQEVYFIENLDQIVNAERLTTENSLFLERDLPRGKPYRWNSDDNITVEGMLQYPLGKFEQKNLPLFVLIHGGPYSADGNQFEASWYMWATIAATEGWLVLMPNYRGSTGYGDQFLIQVIHEIVSRPGKDILAGVDSLVRDGIADPNHLTIGGYSYGGYLTNWLITQTTRFKAAVTGAGAVEHIANWGNDDVSLNDAYFLGGYPWEVPQQYHSEAAIYYVDKIETPTHMVAGDKDIRVAVLESYLFERALNTLNVPCKLLVFPGEGHSLDENPWHGKIKVREELRWLKMYGNRTV